MARNMKKYSERCEKNRKSIQEYWDKRKSLEELEKKIDDSEGNAKEQLKYIAEYRKREEELRRLESECDNDDMPFK